MPISLKLSTQKKRSTQCMHNHIIFLLFSQIKMGGCGRFNPLPPPPLKLWVFKTPSKWRWIIKSLKTTFTLVCLSSTGGWIMQQTNVKYKSADLQIFKDVSKSNTAFVFANISNWTYYVFHILPRICTV